jgi:NAD(P)-dependent dehydrogenase (short-subunit alcohol dehydrogenase family)
MELEPGRGAMTHFAGKRVLVTGAASGIGRAVALCAAEKGGRLVLTDRNAEGLERVAQEVRDGGGEVLMARAFDITDFDAVQSLAADVHAEHGSVDIVVNNAGIAIWGTVDQMPHEDWRRVIDVNLMGPIHVIECFVPEMMRAGRGGHVVNVSSAAGLFGLPWHAAYSASKFGLRGLSEVLRFDLRRHGIRVTLVCPGGVRTGLVQTIEVRGVDTSSRRFQRFSRLFERHAVTAERAAACIVRGVERNKYLVSTSPGILVGHWFQRVFPWTYELVMRRMNREMHARLPVASSQEEPR